MRPEREMNWLTNIQTAVLLSAGSSSLLHLFWKMEKFSDLLNLRTSRVSRLAEDLTDKSTETSCWHRWSSRQSKWILSKTQLMITESYHKLWLIYVVYVYWCNCLLISCTEAIFFGLAACLIRSMICNIGIFASTWNDAEGFDRPRECDSTIHSVLADRFRCDIHKQQRTAKINKQIKARALLLFTYMFLTPCITLR